MGRLLHGDANAIDNLMEVAGDCGFLGYLASKGKRGSVK